MLVLASSGRARHPGHVEQIVRGHSSPHSLEPALLHFLLCEALLHAETDELLSCGRDPIEDHLKAHDRAE